MQLFLQDETSSYRKCSHIYSDRLQVVINEGRYGCSDPVGNLEVEALRNILLAYKKLDTIFVSQFEGLKPYYECNLSDLTNNPVEVPHISFKVDNQILQDIIDQKGEDIDDDNKPDHRREHRLALRKKIYYFHYRHGLYVSRYEPFVNKSTYGVEEVAVKAVALSLFELIKLTRNMTDELVNQCYKEVLPPSGIRYTRVE